MVGSKFGKSIVSPDPIGDYLRGGWGVPKMIMWGSQDQEISPSKWVHRDHAGSSLSLEDFTMKINQHMLTWS